MKHITLRVGCLICCALAMHVVAGEAAGQETAVTLESLPALADLPAIQELPDPFRFIDGSRVTTQQDWQRRRNEIRLQVQKYIYGPMPTDTGKVTSSFKDKRLTVKCSHGDRSISFDARISYPSEGEGPFPAVISIGRWLTLPRATLTELGIAVIYFPNDDIARQGSARDQGRGKFYELYGSEHPAGSLMAWAWGVGRLIDALQQTPQTKINTKRLAVTGCSRNGKGALVCGAFDERIALTIPTESGAGGASSWRVADTMLARGLKVQTARQIVGENTWMAPAFRQAGDKVTRLPVDQHLVAALCAPRGLLLTSNTAFLWLGRESSYITGIAAQKVWQALGVASHMGFVQTSHPDHCSFKEVKELKAFCTRFLLDGEADTQVLKTDGRFKVETSKWIPWKTPDLKNE